MYRRDALKYLACGLSGAVVGGGIATVIFRHDILPNSRSLIVPSFFADLYDARFLNAMQNASISDLVDLLEEAGVYSQGRFDVASLSENAESHELVEFNGFYYTEPELALYTLIARLGRVGYGPTGSTDTTNGVGC